MKTWAIAIMIALSGTVSGQQLKLTRTQCMHLVTESRANLPLMSTDELSARAVTLELCFDALDGSAWQETDVARTVLIQGKIINRLREFITKHGLDPELQKESEIRPRSK